MHIIDKYFFPGFVRKAVTFTIDDGNIEMDKKFLSIVRPSGILGTFNLSDTDKLTPEEYREMYQGYEIANHVDKHPELFIPGRKYIFSDDPFDPASADPNKLYRHESVDGLWYINNSYYSANPTPEQLRRWFKITDVENYIRLINVAHERQNAIFGEGNVRSFVWPFGKQVDSKKIIEHVKKLGYYGARDAGTPLAEFNMPSDRMNWRYNANDSCLLTKMKEFEALPDDGSLKLFSFGVHSIDYDRAGRWGDLEFFAKAYGARPDEFWYATVGEIFDYEDALKLLSVTDTEINNPSSLDLYILLDGKKTVVKKQSSISLVQNQ